MPRKTSRTVAQSGSAGSVGGDTGCPANGKEEERVGDARARDGRGHTLAGRAGGTDESQLYTTSNRTDLSALRLRVRSKGRPTSTRDRSGSHQGV